MKEAASSYLGNIFARVYLAFILSLIGFSIISLVGQHFAWAAEAHIAYRSSASISSSTATLLAPPSNTSQPSYPTIINGQWYCQPPYIALARQLSKTPDGNINFQVDCVLNNLSFPCSDRKGPNGSLQPNENIIKQDWLSGDIPTKLGPNAPHSSGHLMYTYPGDSYAYPPITTLFGYMEILSWSLMTPSILLMGYNLLLGASTFRYSNSLEGFSRLVLGGLAVGISFILVQMLINLENTATIAIGQLHAQFPFPRTTVNRMQIPYTLPIESSKAFSGSSYRGLVVPMSRWGCAVNDFISIFAPRFILNTIAPVIPIFGKLAYLAGKTTTLPDLIHHVGDMIMTVLSILLWAQVFVRIILINYYILMAPLSFSCWVLPGGAGQKIVALWFKGFFSVLFVQVLQIFILTTLPLILPTLPQISSDSVGIMQGFLVECPPILTLSVALMAPTLTGATAGKVLGTAGSMTGQTIMVVGTAASQGM